MKKTLFLILLLTGIGSTMFAQVLVQTYDYPSATEMRFNSIPPGYTRAIFVFRMPKSKARIQLGLTNLQHLNSLPNLDSLLGECLQAIRGIVDSTPVDNIARRIDAIPIDQKVEIRTISHESNQNTMVYQQGILQNFKIDQDTLRISFYSYNEKSFRRYAAGFISVHVNFLKDLYSLPPQVMDSSVGLLRKYFTADVISRINEQESVSALFDLSQGVIINPSVESLKKMGKRAYYRTSNNEGTFLPAIYGSLQYVRGALAPSFAAGISYVISDNKRNDHRVYLMWEPYFLFSRESNQLKTDRNDFITLRKVEYFKPEKGGWSFVQNFSVGYLVGRRGNWFEPNTFKFSLPGVRNYTMQLEPEFYFNGFFKNFSPSLRFCLFFE